MPNPFEGLDHLDLHSDLRITCGEVTLKIVPIRDYPTLAANVTNGLFPDGSSITMGTWYDPEHLEVSARRTLGYHFDRLTWAKKNKWDFVFGIYVPASEEFPANTRDGVVLAGVQSIGTEDDYAHTGEAGTGSYLAPQYRAHGYGKQARAAIVDFAFSHMGVNHMLTSALVYNDQSNGVSRAIGYEPDGIKLSEVAGGEWHELNCYRLRKEDWETKHRNNFPPVTISGEESIVAQIS